MKPIIHILGPGGAGKSTASLLLASNMGWNFIDLDEVFLRAHGNISTFINERGYEAYARQNVNNYVQSIERIDTPTVIALSSGFMTYQEDTEAHYQNIRNEIASHPFSAVLLPSFDLEECVEIIISRQISRDYLQVDMVREEQKIRSRFGLFMQLGCKRFLSYESPEQIVENLKAFVTYNPLFKKYLNTYHLNKN